MKRKRQTEEALLNVKMISQLEIEIQREEEGRDRQRKSQLLYIKMSSQGERERQ